MPKIKISADHIKVSPGKENVEALTKVEAVGRVSVISKKTQDKLIAKHDSKAKFLQALGKKDKITVTK